MHGGGQLTPAAGVRGRGLSHLSYHRADVGLSPSSHFYSAWPSGCCSWPTPYPQTPDAWPGCRYGLEGTSYPKAVHMEPLGDLSPEQKQLVSQEVVHFSPWHWGLCQGSPSGPELRGQLKGAEQAPFCELGLCGQLIWESLWVLDARGSRTGPGTGCVIEPHRMKPVCVCTHMHTHACTHIHTHMHTCTSGCIYTRTHMHRHVNMHSHTCVHTHMYTSACAHACTECTCTRIHSHMHRHTFTHVCAHTHIHRCMHMLTCTHIHAHTCVHISTHIDAHTFMHAHTCIHIYMHTQSYTCTYAHTGAYTHSHMRAHIHTQVHMHAHMHAHVYIHTHLHMHTLIHTDTVQHEYMSLGIQIRSPVCPLHLLAALLPSLYRRPLTGEMG